MWEFFETAAFAQVRGCLDEAPRPVQEALVNARASLGSTALHRAALKTDNPAVVMVLLAAGADAVAHNVWGKTPWGLRPRERRQAEVRPRRFFSLRQS